MPTYQYRCDNCGHEFEEFQSIVDDPLTVCPKCGGKVHRIISGGAGFIFKGSGFYITDYKKKEASYRESSSGEKHSSSSSSDSGSGGDKSDKAAKTEAKSESKTGPKSDSKSSAA